MHLRTPRRGRGLVATAATLGLLGLPLLTSTAGAAPAGAGATTPPAVKVMTRNVYLGADIMRPIVALRTAEAQPGANAITVLNAFAHANEGTRDTVDQTDFHARAKLLAGELATRKP